MTFEFHSPLRQIGVSFLAIARQKIGFSQLFILACLFQTRVYIYIQYIQTYTDIYADIYTFYASFYRIFLLSRTSLLAAMYVYNALYTCLYFVASILLLILVFPEVLYMITCIWICSLGPCCTCLLRNIHCQHELYGCGTQESSLSYTPSVGDKMMWNHWELGTLSEHRSTIFFTCRTGVVN